MGNNGCSGVPGAVQHAALQQGLAVVDLQAGGNRSAVLLADGSVVTFGEGVGGVAGAERQLPA
jgi:alpha-tubulin suppressor-like RCC1 family protein